MNRQSGEFDLSLAQKIGLIVSIIGFICLAVMDEFYGRIGILKEQAPLFDQVYLLRSFIIMLLTGLFIRSVIGNEKPELCLEDKRSKSYLTISIFVVSLLSITSSVIFYVNPPLFSLLSQEDNIIEWSSAIFLILSSGIILMTYLNYDKKNRMSSFVLLSLATILFIIAIEEISWFQRIIDIRTPKSFSGNIQKELNLHNFATNYVENAYYFGVFVFFIVFPFFNIIYKKAIHRSQLSIFIAPPYFILLGAYFCVFNYDMWNILLTQISFYGSILALIALQYFCQSNRDKFRVRLTLVIVFTIQLLFLSHGEHLVRSWEITEYKELLIPLCFFFYSIELFRSIKKKP